MAVSLEEKIEVVQRMEAGENWQEALQQVGVQVRESTAYLWRQKWREGGADALLDGRHGYRHKMNDEIRQWLKETCDADPNQTSPQLQQEISRRYGINVSQGHINLLRGEMGVSRPKKSRNESSASGGQV